MKRYTLYIGLNDKDTRKQIIQTAEAVNIVSGYCWDNLDGATLQTGSGLYRHDDGGKVNENTIILTVNDYSGTMYPAILEACAVFKKALNQESILLTAEALEICDLI